MDIDRILERFGMEGFSVDNREEAVYTGYTVLLRWLVLDGYSRQLTPNQECIGWNKDGTP